MITPNTLRAIALGQDPELMSRALVESANVLQLALAVIQEAKHTIHAWHNMRTEDVGKATANGVGVPAAGQAEVMMWDLYQGSPEMKMINSFLRYRDPIKPADVEFAERLREELQGQIDNAAPVTIFSGTVGELRSLAETVAIASK